MNIYCRLLVLFSILILGCPGPELFVKKKTTIIPGTADKGNFSEGQSQPDDSIGTILGTEIGFSDGVLENITQVKEHYQWALEKIWVLEEYYVRALEAQQRGEDSLALAEFDTALVIWLEVDEGVAGFANGEFAQLSTEIKQGYYDLIFGMKEMPLESPASIIRERIGEFESEPAVGEVVEDTSYSMEDEILYFLKKKRRIENVVFDPIPLVVNDKVKKAIKFFQGSGRKPFELWLERYGKYGSVFEGILKKESLPDDLVYVAMIESGFNPKAYSWARAVGPWQFIYSTGKLFGLERNWWYDERRDPIKSTYAAITYLKGLYYDFGDWYLALAGYNCGERRVERAMKLHQTGDFWQLPTLPRQTRNYVPTFIAAALISKNPKDYGFDPIFDDPWEYDVVTVEECVDLNIAAKCVRSNVNELKALNPELRRWCTPPDVDHYPLRVPKGTASRFQEEYAKIPKGKKTSWVHYRIRRGETLSVIARKYHTSVSAIMTANRLRSRHRIKAGKVLLIPVPASEYYAQRASRKEKKPGYKKVVYRVKRGDTLGEIAEDYHTRASNIRRWNNMRYGQFIYPGQKLVLWISQGRDVERGSDGSGELVYVVKKGDTLWSIARAYRVDVEALRKQNGLGAKGVIKPGDRLKIRGK